MDTSIPITPTPPVVTEQELCRWLGGARPGDTLAYYRGHLARDLAPTGSCLPDRDRAALQRLARRAWFAAETGLADLVQRRNGPDDYTYLIVARRRPKPERGSLSALLAMREPASS